MAVSPPSATRHSWLTKLGYSHRRELDPVDDDDVHMKPRPALPTFGSVRNRKPRETSPTEYERPLRTVVAESTSGFEQ
ncbi:hypothetical protein N0V88_003644 [Collariella sp. IMI 366227]|nr:hypothetical protein N0V88_003644 [Collariella sp. IMI 366227]